ncbi:hypothetical protein D3C87_1133440 [compost metagenome]
MQGGVDQVVAFVVQALGELDDQDRVLRRQADDGDQSDLEEHVVGHPAQGHGQHRAEYAQRHHQQHRGRDRPALVQRRQAQEHDQQRQPQKDRRLAAGQTFLQRQPGPFLAQARRALRHQPLDLGHGLTGAVARRRLTGNADRRVAVVAGQLRRALSPFGLYKGRQGHHFFLGVAHVNLQQVSHLTALIAFGLHHDALHPPLIGEVVDVGRAHGRGQHVADVGKGHPQRVGLLAVDDQLHLRCLGQGAFAHVHQDRAFFGRRE